MRKSILLLAFFIISGITFAQMKKDRTTAYNYWQKGELSKAKEYIDKAIASPDAASDAKAWFYKGSIYLDLSLKAELKVLFPDALDIALEATTKAKQLDTKNEFKTEIMTNLATISGRYYDQGVILLTSKDPTRNTYLEAAKFFEKTIKISTDNNTTDTSAYLGLGISYNYAGDTANAITAFRKLIEMKAKDSIAYNSISNLYKGKGDIDNAFKYVNKGLEMFPNNTDLIITRVNLYILTKQNEKALQSLYEVQKRQPKNASIQHAIGVTNDLLKNDTTISATEREKYFNNAIKAYEEAIKMDSTNFDALFNLGVIYFNKGGDIINVANKLPLNETKKYDEMMVEGNSNLKLALPYFEKAQKLNDKDPLLLSSLKEIYTRLNMMDKLKELNAKLGK